MELNIILFQRLLSWNSVTWSQTCLLSRRLSWKCCYSKNHLWVEKNSGNGVFTRTQFPFNLSWVLTIHKSQGKTLERLGIDLGAGEKFSDLMLVALLRVRMFKQFFLKPLLLNDYARSTPLLVWLISITPFLHWNKRPLIQEFSIQSYFNTNASFLSHSFTDIISSILGIRLERPELRLIMITILLLSLSWD